MVTIEIIGRRIAQERIKRGLTQEDLAGLAEIDRSFLSYIENGRKNFSMEMYLRICEQLKVSPDKLLSDS